MSSVGESAYLLVAPPGMPGNTVIWPPTLTSSGRIGVPSSRVRRTGLPPFAFGSKPVRNPQLVDHVEHRLAGDLLVLLGDHRLVPVLNGDLVRQQLLRPREDRE